MATALLIGSTSFVLLHVVPDLGASGQTIATLGRSPAYSVVHPWLDGACKIMGAPSGGYAEPELLRDFGSCTDVDTQVAGRLDAPNSNVTLGEGDTILLDTCLIIAGIEHEAEGGGVIHNAVQSDPNRLAVAFALQEATELGHASNHIIESRWQFRPWTHPQRVGCGDLILA